MGQRRKAGKARNTGICLGDLLPKPDEPTEPDKPKEPAPDGLGARVDDLKTKATAEKVPWSEALEKKLRACGTKGEIKRAWRKHRIASGV